MATFDDVLRKIDGLSEAVRKEVPGLIAKTAAEHFRGRFRNEAKGWDGKPWAPTKRPNPRGSLMNRTGALMNTIRPTLISEREVRIGAGGPNVPYARIHNEGGVIKHPGGTAYMPTKDKRFTWVRNEVADGSDLPRTKPHDITIPKRQFMGHSAALNDEINARLDALVKQTFK